MTPKFVRLLPGGDPETGLQASNLIAEGNFTTGDTTEIGHDFYESDDKKISTGVWECAPCREEIKAYPVDEMMTVISGSVTLTDPDGSAETFTAGDTFFIAKGTSCVWHVTETLRKFYMIAA